MTTGAFAGSTRLPAFGRRAAQEVARQLTSATTVMRTGDLHISGDPGGRIRVVQGRVLMVSTAGAPGVSDLLARPGRAVSGDAERRALEQIATLDAAFAIAAGWIDGSFWTTDIDMDPVGPGGRVLERYFTGIEADRLTAETERRLRALANRRVSPHRNRLVRTEYGESLLGDCPPGQRREILLRVDGQNRCRDIAFALGRGLYPVTVEVSRLLADHALLVPSGSEVRADQPDPDVPLPRRCRGASGINDLYPPRAQELPDTTSP